MCFWLPAITFISCLLINGGNGENHGTANDERELYRTCNVMPCPDGYECVKKYTFNWWCVKKTDPEPSCNPGTCCYQSDCLDGDICIGANFLNCKCSAGTISEPTGYGACYGIGDYFTTGTDISIDVSSGGLTREAEVHLPPESSWQEPMPLVLNIHAMMCTPFLQRALTRFNLLADEEGFIIVYPQGYERPDIIDDPLGINTISFGYTFNAGGCCPRAITEKIDDVGFMRDLVAYISNTMGPQQGFSVDPKRIYATGMSNGAFMSHRLGCQLSDVVAAIAPVAGVMTGEKDIRLWNDDPYECNPSAPVPVLHIHDRHDEFVWFRGWNPTTNFPSVKDSIDSWKRINGVAGDQGVLTFTNGPYSGYNCVECTSYGSGRSNVTLCETDCPVTDPHFGHSWPGFSGGSNYLEATEQIWEFFKSHPKA